MSKAFKRWYKAQDFWKDHEDSYLEMWSILEQDFGVDEEVIEEIFDKLIWLTRDEYGD